MAESLKIKYQNLLKKYGLDTDISQKKSHCNGSLILNPFMKSNKQVAIYGYGELTNKLMGDFIFELREVKYIIDDNITDEKSGYNIISESEIDKYGIDGIILCCKNNVEETAKRIATNSACVHFLTLEKIYGSDLLYIGPYSTYTQINFLQNKIDSSLNLDVQIMLNLLTKYIIIKNFQSAINVGKKICKVINHQLIISLVDDLKDLYESMLSVAKKKSDNVLMFCIDGLKRVDMPSIRMPKMSTIVYEKGYRYTNAYSASNSTFESLMPTYSGNCDLRTEYYKSNILPSESCNFINEANRQGRNIYFYTDIWKYIDNDYINFNVNFTTASEKIWDFLVDYENEEYGLFYVHIGMETHYSFPNPYTKEPLVAKETNVLIEDYRKMVDGAKMQADYSQQKKDSFRYIDDLVAPFLDKLSCRTLIFADHGNYEDFIYSPKTKFEEVPKLDFSCAETLIRIPFVIMSPEQGGGYSDDLISLMELPNILMALLNNKKFDYKEKPFIKVQRSELYNPEFRFLCKLAGIEREMLAFECFIFTSKYKLVVYSDGSVSLYYTENDREVPDKMLKKMLFSCILNEITVCDSSLCAEYLAKESVVS